ncbi:MAG: hypothetical protein KA419_02595 [Acidobacteria bacterium]|nr:hypothetical protein [Acidobacteriota bacterium]
MHCPICRSEMERREMAPCFVCGHAPRELDEFRQGAHTYAEYEVFPGERMVLCDFCDADFGSFFPDYWGFPPSREMDLTEEQLIGPAENPTLALDWFCPVCRYRLKFLAVRKRVLQRNGVPGEAPAPPPLSPPAPPLPGLAPPPAGGIPEPPSGGTAAQSRPVRAGRRRRSRMLADPTVQLLGVLILAPLCAIFGMSLSSGARGKTPALLGWLATFVLWSLAAWRSVRHQWQALPRLPGRRVPVLPHSLTRLRLLTGVTFFALISTLCTLVLLAVLVTKAFRA